MLDVLLALSPNLTPAQLADAAQTRNRPCSFHWNAAYRKWLRKDSIGPL